MRSRLRAFWQAFRRSDVERDMADELQFHMAARAEDLTKQGLSRAEAISRARLEFGNVDVCKEECRDALGVRLLHDLRADARYAVRSLRRSPSFSSAAILTLALGTGVGIGLFIGVNTLLLRPIPVTDPASLYQVQGYQADRGLSGVFSEREYRAIASSSSVLGQVIADAPVGARVDGVRLSGRLVSENYFTVLGMKTTVGRPILIDDMPASAAVAVLSHAAWQRMFASSPGALGRTLAIENATYTIVGVADSECTGMDAQIPDFWALMPAGPANGGRRRSAVEEGAPSLRVIGRLRPDITVPAAERSLAALLAEITRLRAPQLRLTDARLDSRATYQNWSHSNPANVIPLLAAIVLILLIACTNVSNLLLARTLNRRRELAIRLSLGASLGRIVRQLATESVLLGLAAGTVGLVLAFWCWSFIRHQLAASMSSAPAISLVEPSLDYRVLGFAFVVSLGAGLLFGLTPAVHVVRRILGAARHGEGKLVGSLPVHSLRSALVVVQFALSLVLLIGAGLLLRSAARFAAVDPGFDLAHTITVQSIRDRREADPAIDSRIVDGLRRLPGVVLVAPALRVPLRGSLPGASIDVVGDESMSGRVVEFNEVSADFFAALGIPIVRGRAFTTQEAASGAAVAVVSDATARRLWPDRNAIGESFRIAASRSAPGAPEDAQELRTIQVVGIAGDIVSAWLWNGTDSTCIYLPPREGPPDGHSILLRADRDAKALMPSLRASLSAAHPGEEFDVRPMADLQALQVRPFRLTAWTAAGLSGLGLLLACVGIYGIVAYVTNQRAREIGIRTALGARRADVLRLMMRDGCRLMAIALAAGLVLAYGFSRILGAMIFGIGQTDPVAFASAAGVLTIVGTLAVYLPSRKATRVNPGNALRCE